MTEIAQMTTEQLVALLREKGWEIFEDGEDHVWAMEDIDLTRSVTDGYYGVYRETYPAAFRTPTYVRWSLDLQARTAWYYLFDGSPTGSEYLEEGDFEWAVEMNVRDAGAIPLTRLIEGHSEPSCECYELVRVDRLWWCALFAVKPGDHFIHAVGNPNVAPSGVHSYYRIGEETVARLLEMGPEEAHRRMESGVEAIEKLEKSNLGFD